MTGHASQCLIFSQHIQPGIIGPANFSCEFDRFSRSFAHDARPAQDLRRRRRTRAHDACGRGSRHESVGGLRGGRRAGGTLSDAALRPGGPRHRIDRDGTAVPARGPRGARPRVDGAVGAGGSRRPDHRRGRHRREPDDRLLLAAAPARHLPLGQSRRPPQCGDPQHARGRERGGRRCGECRPRRGADPAPGTGAPAHRPGQSRAGRRGWPAASSGRCGRPARSSGHHLGDPRGGFGNAAGPRGPRLPREA